MIIDFRFRVLGSEVQKKAVRITLNAEPLNVEPY
jgi:hypothetical protein